MPASEHELRILEEIERNPDMTQASLANQLGVAVGSVNWYLKRLVSKGYIKVKHLQRRKLHYFLTPSGLALKVRLTRNYMDVSLRVYRELRHQARHVIAQLRQAGYASVRIDGNEETLEIFRLTCIEQNLPLENNSARVPAVCAHGAAFVIQWPAGSNLSTVRDMPVSHRPQRSEGALRA
jgi:DNA-binding MarR family transcriptional regulator